MLTSSIVPTLAAVRPVAIHLPRVIEALASILSTCSLANNAWADGVSVKNYFQSFEAIVLLTIWVKLLQCIDNRNVILQSGKISLEVKAANVNALKGEIQAFRNKWDSFLSEASLIAQVIYIPPQFKGEVSRERKRKRSAVRGRGRGSLVRPRRKPNRKTVQVLWKKSTLHFMVKLWLLLGLYIILLL